LGYENLKKLLSLTVEPTKTEYIHFRLALSAVYVF